MEPIMNLRGHCAQVTSVCFIPSSTTNPRNNNKNSSHHHRHHPTLTDDIHTHKHNITNDAILQSVSSSIRSSSSSSSSNNQYSSSLLSCDVDGNMYLWNLMTREIVGKWNVGAAAGGGLSIQRMGVENENDSSLIYIVYQTRDGLLRIYKLSDLLVAKDELSTSPTVIIDSGSRGFCCASVCKSLNQNYARNILATSSETGEDVQVWDLSYSSEVPIVCFNASDLHDIDCSNNKIEQQHGMLMSLAVLEFDHKLIVTCGMESGTVFVHELQVDSANSNFLQGTKGKIIRRMSCRSLKVGKDAVLSIDQVLSCAKDSAIVCIAGIAGDENTSEPTLIRFKYSVSETKDGEQKLYLSKVFPVASSSKRGISIVRFRSDGRLVAGGGWDNGIRIYTRNGKYLGILHNHEDSISSLDWDSNGLLAAGSSDGRISLYKLSL